MMYPHPTIAKEGWLYLVVIGVLAFAGAFAGVLRKYGINASAGSRLD